METLNEATSVFAGVDFDYRSLAILMLLVLPTNLRPNSAGRIGPSAALCFAFLFAALTLYATPSPTNWVLVSVDYGLIILGLALGVWAEIHAAKGHIERQLAYLCLAIFGVAYSLWCLRSDLFSTSQSVELKLYHFVIGLNTLLFFYYYLIVTNSLRKTRELDLASKTAKPKDAWPIDELA